MEMQSGACVKLLELVVTSSTENYPGMLRMALRWAPMAPRPIKATSAHPISTRAIVCDLMDNYMLRLARGW
jgi:hypothetical protein